MVNFICPVDNPRVTSPYGMRNIGAGPEFHYGIDLGDKEGTPIHASASGTVHIASAVDSYGNFIAINHNIDGNAYSTGYAHLSKINVAVGQKVQRGQVIGLMGSTGRSTGPHLHFEVHTGHWVRQVVGNQNPMNYISLSDTPSKHGVGGDGGGGHTPYAGQYAEYINGAAKQHGIDPWIIAAIIKQESNFNPKAESHAGAVGLMQLMPATAKEMGLSLSDRTDPKKNIYAGTGYIMKYAEKYFDFVVVDSLRAYNMGPFGYRDHLAGNRKLPKETQNYTVKIAQHYNKMTGKDLPKTFLISDMGFGSGGGGFGSLTGESIGTANEIGEALSALNSVTRIAGVSPNPTKDSYPKHRYQQNPFTLRIGDSQFYIPPINIKHSKVGATGYVPTMRHRTGMLNKSGWTEGQIVVNMMFADIDQINGYEVEAPGGRKYHMDGVRSLLAQFHKNPMLPVRNEYINNALGIFNVIIKDIVITTVEGFPNMLNVTIVMNECTTTPYTGAPEFMYDVCFNYPVWRWFYHNLLDEKETNRIESVYLRPIQERMRSEVLYRILSEDEIDNMQRDLIEKSKASNPSSRIPDLNPQYLLSRFKGANLRSLMSKWDIGDAIPTSVTVSISKELSRLNMMEYEQPVFQDMGGIHKVFEITYKMTDREQVFAMEELVRQVEKTAREYRHMFVGGFVEIHNDIINMCGVDFCMIEELKVDTSPINGVYDVSIILREFNPNQGNNETLNGIETDIHKFAEGREFTEADEDKYTSHKADRFNTVHEEWQVEQLIKQVELYPDLRLPSLVDANKALATINKWRKEKGYETVPFDTFPQREGDIWVEPDFYFMYPAPQDAYDAMNAGELGTKMINFIDTGEYDGYSSPNKWENYLDLAGGATHALGKFSGSVADNSFNLEETQDKVRQTAETSILYPGNPLYMNFFEEWGSNKQMYGPKELASYMLRDQVVYDQRLRMTRFFPTYFMLFVDEGVWIDGRRLWNTHYAYHAVHEITVTKDKLNPVSLAYLKLSNMYGTFNSESKMRDPEYYKDFEPRTFWDRFKTMWKAWGYSAKDIMAEARQMMDHAELQVGARIHLRMGNSSNTGSLPTVFNGQITSINDGVDIEIFAQSDGVELVNGPISGNVGDGTPSEPHNALMRYFTKRMSNYWFTVAPDLEFFYNFESYYGIEHFGWVASKDSKDTGVMNWVNAVFESEDKKTAETGTINAFDAMMANIGEFFGKIGSVISATIQNFDSLVSANFEYIVGAFTGTPTFLVYDVMKNIYRGDPDNASTGVNHKTGSEFNTGTSAVDIITQIMFSGNRDNEKNVKLSEYGKTVWDIGQSLSTFVPEFIFATHDHGFRSTAFFGMPHWMVKFRYHKPEGVKGRDLSQWQEEIKPFQQAHMLSSNIDIIKNDIKASSEHLKHIMTAIYTMGDATNSKEGVTVYADKSILKDQQKRTVIDTGVLQDLFGPDSVMTFLMTWIVKPIASTIVDLGTTGIELGVDLTRLLIPKSLERAWGIEEGVDLSEWADRANDWFDELAEPGKYQAESIVIGSMQRNFNEMYQGEIVTFGMPSMKPWDIFYMDDERRMLSGTTQVGAITHTISRQTGMVSVIKPDLIVSRVDGKGYRNVVLQSALFALAAGSMFGLRYMSKTKFAGWLASGSYKKMKALSIKTAKGADWVANRFTGLKPLEKFAQVLDETKVDDWVKTGANWLRRGIVTTVFAGIAMEAFSQWWDKHTKYNNVIYIHPLFKAGVPFTAGIKGAMHIIPNYIDPLYYDPDGSGNGVIEKAQKFTDYPIINPNPFGQNSFIPNGNGGGSFGSNDSTNTHNTQGAPGNVFTPTPENGNEIAFEKYTGGASTKVTKSFAQLGLAGALKHPFKAELSKRIKNFNGATADYGVDLQYKTKISNEPTVYSCHPGTVVLAKTISGKGLTVIIRHEALGHTTFFPKVFFTSYSHLKAGSLTVKAGDKVSHGKIGVMGSTESSTAKLHLEVHIDSYTDSESSKVGSRVNPVDFFKKAGVSL